MMKVKRLSAASGVAHGDSNSRQYHLFSWGIVPSAVSAVPNSVYA